MAGVLARGASKKRWNSCLFLQPLKLANLVYNLGLGLFYQIKQRLGRKLAVGPGPGEHPKKNWDPLFISETAEASD